MIIGDAYRIIFVTACQGVHVDETKINAMQNIIKGDAMWVSLFRISMQF